MSSVPTREGRDLSFPRAAIIMEGGAQNRAARCVAFAIATPVPADTYI